MGLVFIVFFRIGTQRGLTPNAGLEVLEACYAWLPQGGKLDSNPQVLRGKDPKTLQNLFSV